MTLAPQLLMWATGMSLNNIVSLQAAREIKRAREEDPAYAARIAGLDKVELLEEMVRFQEERSRIGELTLPMMIQGRILFEALEATAETEELALLTGSYRRHLEHEMKDFLNKGKRLS